MSCVHTPPAARIVHLPRRLPGLPGLLVRARRAGVFAPAAVALLLASGATAQTWEYRSYLRDKLSNEYSKDHYQVATVELRTDGEGRGTFRMIAPKLDACYRSALPAAIERTPETTTITVTQVLTGCDVFRYVIRNDGSGGVKQVMRDGAWRGDGFDHGLTPVK